ncbi:MAG: V4R domain-containing protein [Vicinamibacterales bacterium]
MTRRLPFRVEFYEHYLQTSRLRTASIGMAPFLAALSFLRQEGDVYYDIVTDAGQQAAAWALEGVGGWHRQAWKWLPRRARLRVALRLARRLAAEATPLTPCRVRVRRKQGRIHLEESPFCQVRTPAEAPLCGFYAAALSHFVEMLDLDVIVQHESCRAMGDAACEIAALPQPIGAAAATREEGFRLEL